MPNNWFQFKQFKITQAHSAMKVSTDACIQGAWTADFLQQFKYKPDFRILDIGCGTGLLSLMLAQALPLAQTDAIEIDNAAHQEANRNFAQSAWQERVTAHHISLQEYHPDKQYDFIICNPPFFHKQLQASGTRNTARHDVSLSKQDLVTHASRLLSRRGNISVLFPDSEWKDWINITADNGLFPKVILNIYPATGKKANRITGIFSKDIIQQEKQSCLEIRDAANQYSDEFKALMQPYYLHL